MLEDRLGKIIVRNEFSRIINQFKIELTKDSLNNSIYRLSLNRQNQLKVLTTNYDRVMELTIKESGNTSTKQYGIDSLLTDLNEANGVIHLHNFLTAKPTPSQINSLVISTDDMAGNYIGDNARVVQFLSRVLKEYTICFVGYSMNDVLFTYLLRALSEIKLNLYSFFSDVI